WSWAGWRRQRQIGYGGGVSLGMETMSFMALSLFAGQLGPVPLAAYGIVINVLALIFMVAAGLGAATAVRVGIAHGRRDWPDQALAGWTGLGANTAMMLLLGAVLMLFPETIAGAYTTDPAVLAVVAQPIAFTALILVADGGQTVMLNALRGRNDVLIPTIL